MCQPSLNVRRGAKFQIVLNAGKNRKSTIKNKDLNRYTMPQARMRCASSVFGQLRLTEVLPNFSKRFFRFGCKGSMRKNYVSI